MRLDYKRKCVSLWSTDQQYNVQGWLLITQCLYVMQVVPPPSPCWENKILCRHYKSLGMKWHQFSHQTWHKFLTQTNHKVLIGHIKWNPFSKCFHIYISPLPDSLQVTQCCGHWWQNRQTARVLGSLRVFPIFKVIAEPFVAREIIDS